MFIVRSSEKRFLVKPIVSLDMLALAFVSESSAKVKTAHLPTSEHKIGLDLMENSFRFHVSLFRALFYGWQSRNVGHVRFINKIEASLLYLVDIKAG